VSARIIPWRWLTGVARNNLLTHAPLPSFRQLASLARATEMTDAELAAPWTRKGDIAGWLTRSTWSLTLIVLWRQKCQPDRRVTVWVPDFFCNAALAGVRATGAELIFFPVNKNLEPNAPACRALAADSPPDIAVHVHYFGKPREGRVLRDLCGAHGAWLVEDAAHIVRQAPSIGTIGDFILYSPHKHLPIPDGAVLVITPAGASKVGPHGAVEVGPPESWALQLSDLARTPLGRPRLLQSPLGWLSKRVLQKCAIRPKSARALFSSENTAEALPHQAAIGPVAASRIMRRLLRPELARLALIRQEGIANQMLWDYLLRGMPAARDLSPSERVPIGEWAPYLAQFACEREARDAERRAELPAGLPFSTWPDLPPEVVCAKDEHRDAWELRHTRVYLPVHHTLDKQEMLAACKHSKWGEHAQDGVELVWDRVTRREWEAMLANAGRSNLLQSWCYGEAKSKNESWSVKRGVFYRRGEALAIVQTLNRRVAGMLRIIRINRGPLFLPGATSRDRELVWERLASIGNARRGRILSVAPELPLTAGSLAMLAAQGFRQSSSAHTESIWADLSLSAEQLSKQLSGRWRRTVKHIGQPETAGLSLDATTNGDAYEWLMERYADLMEAHNFLGIPVPVLGAFRECDERSALILFASRSGERLAGICLAIHGEAATYVVGWNGTEGRKLGANHFLFWSAMIRLKAMGLKWFDLGGISEERTPGISAFKLGLGGERYELVGEYLKW